MRTLRLNPRYIPLLLLLAILASHGNGILGVFQFDDYHVIVDYDYVHSLSAWWSDIGHGMRPLLKLTYTLNWVSGLGLVGFHLVNIGLHLATTLLVYALTLRMLNASQVSQADVAALLATLIFAIHPLATEAVTYISGRSMALMAMFSLAALLAYLKGAQECRLSWLYGWSPLLFILAVASKETAILLPLGLLLWELCFSPTRDLKSLMRRQAMHWFIFLVLLLVLLFNQRYWQMMMFSASQHSISANLFSQLHAMTYLLGQWLLPWTMNIDPDLPVIRDWAQVLPDALLWSVMMVTAMLSVRKRPWLTFAIAWFMLQLLPLYIFLPRLDVANDRQLYLAGWALGVPLAVMWLQLLAKPRLAYALAAALVLALSGMTIARNCDYRSEVALWQATVQSSPHKARAYNNLGFAYAQAGQYAQAEQAYATAIKLDPGNWRAVNNLAQLRAMPHGF